MSRLFTLSDTEFEVAWSELGLPERPVVLDVPSRGRTHEERAVIVERARSGLRSRGLLDRRGVDADLAATCALIARPECSVSAWIQAERPIHGHAALCGDRGVVTAVVDEQVRLHPVIASRTVEAVTSLVGVSPGPGAAVSVPLDALGSDDPDPARGLRARGVPGADARRLVEMVGDARYTAQFSVEVHRHDGRVRGTRLIGLHGSERGWYLQDRRHGRLTVTPATEQRTTAAVESLVADTVSLTRRR